MRGNDKDQTMTGSGKFQIPDQHWELAQGWGGGTETEEGREVTSTTYT